MCTNASVISLWQIGWSKPLIDCTLFSWQVYLFFFLCLQNPFPLIIFYLHPCRNIEPGVRANQAFLWKKQNKIKPPSWLPDGVLLQVAQRGNLENWSHCSCNTSSWLDMHYYSGYLQESLRSILSFGRALPLLALASFSQLLGEASLLLLRSFTHHCKFHPPCTLHRVTQGSADCSPTALGGLSSWFLWWLASYLSCHLFIISSCLLQRFILSSL